MKKARKAKEMFGRTVSFNTVFQNIVYVNDEPADFSRKLFEGDEYSEVHPVNDNSSSFGTRLKPYRLPRSMRKVVFRKQSGEGLIIGQTSKHEGLYSPSVTNYYDPSDNEQASLQRKKTYTFWVVATGINTTVLAEKSSSKVK